MKIYLSCCVVSGSGSPEIITFGMPRNGIHSFHMLQIKLDNKQSKRRETRYHDTTTVHITDSVAMSSSVCFLNNQLGSTRFRLLLFEYLQSSLTKSLPNLVCIIKRLINTLLIITDEMRKLTRVQREKDTKQDFQLSKKIYTFSWFAEQIANYDDDEALIMIKIVIMYYVQFCYITKTGLLLHFRDLSIRIVYANKTFTSLMCTFTFTLHFHSLVE